MLLLLLLLRIYKASVSTFLKRILANFANYHLNSLSGTLLIMIMMEAGSQWS